jgi:hypothetical protein
VVGDGDDPLVGVVGIAGRGVVLEAGKGDILVFGK